VNWCRLSLLLGVCACLCSAQPQPQPEMVRDIRAGAASSIVKGEANGKADRVRVRKAKVSLCLNAARRRAHVRV
jgi:hypothetical protein